MIPLRSGVSDEPVNEASRSISRRASGEEPVRATRSPGEAASDGANLARDRQPHFCEAKNAATFSISWSLSVAAIPLITGLARAPDL